MPHTHTPHTLTHLTHLTLTRTADLHCLLNWRKKSIEDLPQVVTDVTKVPGDEIVKVCDSLHTSLYASPLPLSLSPSPPLSLFSSPLSPLFLSLPTPSSPLPSLPILSSPSPPLSLSSLPPLPLSPYPLSPLSDAVPSGHVQRSVCHHGREGRQIGG